jgi:hypothetical protein
VGVRGLPIPRRVTTVFFTSLPIRIAFGRPLSEIASRFAIVNAGAVRGAFFFKSFHI